MKKKSMYKFISILCSVVLSMVIAIPFFNLIADSLPCEIRNNTTQTIKLYKNSSTSNLFSGDQGGVLFATILPNQTFTYNYNHDNFYILDYISSKNYYIIFEGNRINPIQLEPNNPNSYYYFPSLYNGNYYRKFSINLNVIKLDKPSNIQLNQYTGLITWDSVENATGYRIYRLEQGGYEIYLNNITTTSATLLDDGDYRLIAVDSTGSYESSVYYEFSFDKLEQIKLSTPINITVNNGVVHWGAVINASSYRIQKYSGQNNWTNYQTVNTNEWEYGNNIGMFRIIALSDCEAYINSDPSSSFATNSVIHATAPVITLTDKIITWESVDPLATYEIYFDYYGIDFQLIARTDELYYTCKQNGFYKIKATVPNHSESYFSNEVHYTKASQLGSPFIRLDYINFNGYRISIKNVNQPIDHYDIYKNDVKIGEAEYDNLNDYSHYDIDESGIYKVKAISSSSSYSDSSFSNTLTVQDTDLITPDSGDFWDNALETVKGFFTNITTFLQLIGGTLFAFLPPQLGAFLTSALILMIVIAVIKVIL